MAGVKRGNRLLAVKESSMGKKPRKDKTKIRKIVSDVLKELIRRGVKDLNNSPKSISLSPSSPSTKRIDVEELCCYGLLSNDATKQDELLSSFITTDISENMELVRCTTFNDTQLFASYPAAAKYISPYSDIPPVFLEVITKIDGVYLCRPVENLDYLGLLNKKEEK